MTLKGATASVDVIDIQPAQLRHAQPRTIEKLEDRSIPKSDRVVVRRELAEGAGDPGFQDRRQRLVELRDSEALRRGSTGRWSCRTAHASIDLIVLAFRAIVRRE